MPPLREYLDSARRRLGRTAGSGHGPAREIAFLHIGKCAGTQITHLAAQIEARTGIRIRKHAHRVDLSQIDPDAPYFFPVRHPVSRFHSGFYSRKRKGQPRIYSEWTEAETHAFADFEHANDLAEALFARGARGRKALMAIQSISHTTMHQVDWFARNGYFLEIRPPLWIIRQEHFDADMESLLARAGLGLTLADLSISQETASAHKTDYSAIPPLSDRARENLGRWYARDIEFYRICEDWIRSQHPDG